MSAYYTKRYLHPVALRKRGSIKSYGLGCRCQLCCVSYRSYINGYRHRPGNDVRRRERLALYGLTETSFKNRLEAQGNVCPICGKELESNIGRGCNTHIDHNHKIGGKRPRVGVTVVRGILDKKCNQGIGYFEEEPARMERAARYVRTEGRFDDWVPGIGAGLI